MADSQHPQQRRRLSRRAFLSAASAAGVVALVGCGSGGGSGGGGGSDPIPGTPVVASTVMYRRSVGGKRASRAAKAHAANRLYPTMEAALADPAHPGDRSRIVPLDTTEERYLALFGGGAQVVDLRRP